MLLSLIITFTVLKMHRDLINNPLIRNKDDIIMKLLLPLILVATLSIWKFMISENIFVDHFYPIVYLLTFMWSRNMMLMQVCYVTKQRFHSLNIGNLYDNAGTLTFLAVWVLSIFMYWSDFFI